MKTHNKEKICQLIDNHLLKEAEDLLIKARDLSPDDDEIYFLLGNIHRKQSNWQEALQSYALAIEKNPNSSAKPAREMVKQIIEFYDKERYNI